MHGQPSERPKPMRQRRRWGPLVGALAFGGALAGQDLALRVTVYDERTAETVTDLGPERFAVKDGDTALRVVSARQASAPVDMLLLVDASIVGDAVRPIAEAFMRELDESDSAALVSFDESADLLQDLTSDPMALSAALSRIEYDGLPRLHDALYAAIDGGFNAGSNRKAVVVFSAGEIARGRTSEEEAVRLARAKGASIYSVFVRAGARGTLRRLALRTGGASIAAKRTGLDSRHVAKRLLAAVRGQYEVSVTGVYGLGDRVTAEIVPKSKGSLSASVLPVD
ncbi:MAG: VWA domain-containing protein [Bryobacterales bacterium]|nr:VWA domain-containing protein [Bryobacterales bacterium]